MKLLRALNQKLECVLKGFCVILLMIFTVVVLLQVISRNYIKIPMTWTIEVAMMCFIWSVYLGAAIALRYRKHYIVELLPKNFVRTNAILDIISDITILSIIFVLAWGGCEFTSMGLQRYCSSLPISQAWIFAAMPISGIAMFFFSIENIATGIVNYRNLGKEGAHACRL